MTETDGSEKLYQEAERIIKGLSKTGKFSITAKYEGEYSKIADRLLKEGKDQGKLRCAIYGAKIYELLGKGERPFVLNNLLNAVNLQKGEVDVELLDWIDYFRAKHYPDKFINKDGTHISLVPEGNPEPVFGDPKYIEYKERSGKFHSIPKKNLESEILSFVFGTFILAGIFFSVSSMTGAVIGFSKSFSMPLGIGLFVVGIFGLLGSNSIEDKLDEEEIYFSIPQLDGSFSQIHGHEKDDGDSYYKIVHKKGQDHGKLFYISSEHDKRSMHRYDSYLNPVCSIENLDQFSISEGKNRLDTALEVSKRISLIEPGEVWFNGDKWIISENKKVKIKLK